jgi:hypothetical protein
VQLLVGDEKVMTDGLIANANGSSGSAPLAVAVVPDHRHSFFRLCAMFVCIIVLLILVLGGITVYKSVMPSHAVKDFLGSYVYVFANLLTHFLAFACCVE